MTIEWYETKSQGCIEILHKDHCYCKDFRSLIKRVVHYVSCLNLDSYVLIGSHRIDVTLNECYTVISCDGKVIRSYNAWNVVNCKDWFDSLWDH